MPTADQQRPVALRWQHDRGTPPKRSPLAPTDDPETAFLRAVWSINSARGGYVQAVAADGSVIRQHPPRAVVVETWED